MRGNKNKLVICIYLYIHVLLLQAHLQGPLENIIPWIYFQGFMVYISVIYIPKTNHSEKWSFFKISVLKSMVEIFKKYLQRFQF